MIRRRSYIKRSSKPLKRSPLKREGKRGKAKRLFRVVCREKYFGKEESKPCQFCGFSMEPKDCAAHHKLKRSLGGKDEFENIVCIHHSCHELIHENVHLLAKVKMSKANVLNGEIIVSES